MQLANPGCDVEQKAEPTHPIEKLCFADFATLGWKSTDRVEYLAEKAEDPKIGIRRGPFKTRIAFADVEGGDYDSPAWIVFSESVLLVQRGMTSLETRPESEGSEDVSQDSIFCSKEETKSRKIRTEGDTGDDTKNFELCIA